LGNIFLGVAPKAFENWLGPIFPVFKTNRFLADEQLSTFQSRQGLILLVLKSFWQIQKLLAINGSELLNSK
jgi:hypothetical protein